MTDKAELKKAYIQGYKAGRNIEELEAISIKTAESQFERWYDLNR